VDEKCTETIGQIFVEVWMQQLHVKSSLSSQMP